MDCGAVVKADAYGLGVEKVAPRLAAAGCRTFYVSVLDEAMQLKAVLGSVAAKVKIFVLTGCSPGDEKYFSENSFIPVLVSSEMFYRWLKHCRSSGADASELYSALKINTGMGRLGLEISELESLIVKPDLLKTAGVKYFFSHLACGEDRHHPLNDLQLKRFSLCVENLQKVLPESRFAMANSAGTLFSDKYHFNMVRPGIALYGGQPIENEEFPLKTVASIRLSVIQLRELPAGESVGYGATKRWNEVRTIAVVQCGYADGLLRSLGNSGSGVLVSSLNGKALGDVPMVGRVSMDTVMFDVSGVLECVASRSAATGSAETIRVGDEIELLGGYKTLRSLSAEAGTSCYEILTSLRGRYLRQYIE